MRKRLHLAMLTMALVVTTAIYGRAETSDLREFRVGMNVGDFPASGYLLTCRSDSAIALGAWTDFMRCATDEAGLHGVAVRYDDDANPLAQLNDKWEGTKVGGHPVELTFLIGDDAVLHTLRIVTDPNTRPYLKKKAFLLGRQVKLHYGEDGWLCTDEPPAAGESAVGGRFVKNRCEKTIDRRHLVLDQRLFRQAGQAPPDFYSEVRLEVRLVTR
jgi:hypothetical protein